MNFSKIYELAPQMKVYNELGYKWEPFIMSLQKPNFRSNIVNTDSFGLRFNDQFISKNISIFDKKKEFNKKIGTMLGSSALFGVGASSDNFTIPSILSEKTENHFYNLGGRAYSGFQEVVLFNSLINKLENLQTVIVFSGVNDIFFNSYIEKYDQILGPIFFNKQFKEAMFASSLGWKKKLVKFFFQPFLKDDIDWSNLNKKNLLNNLFKKGNQTTTSNNDNFELIKKIVKRNLICWSNIQRGMKIKLIYFLQPLSIWCKRELSDEEKMIFEELDKFSLKTNNTLKSLNFEIYSKYKNYLSTTCKELDIEFFDCNKYFSNEKFDKKWIFLDRIHMTDLGNKYISELIASKMK